MPRADVTDQFRAVSPACWIASASGASLCLTANGDKTTASPDQYFSWRPHPAHPDRGYPTKCTDEVFTCVGAICYTRHQAHDHLTTCSTFHGAADLTLDECKNAAETLGLPVAADSWQGDERVAIFGTGGISHWVGSPGMGNINQEFDRKILDMVAAGDLEGLIALPDKMVFEEAGNGAIEIKNWICAMSAVPEGKACSIYYEPVFPWVTGCGFAELQRAA